MREEVEEGAVRCEVRKVVTLKQKLRKFGNFSSLLLIGSVVV